jgi:hypothetical protein
LDQVVVGSAPIALMNLVMGTAGAQDKQEALAIYL